MDKKQVDLLISMKQYSENLHPVGTSFRRELTLDGSYEFYSEGTMYRKDGVTYLSYMEPDGSGLEHHKTVIKIRKNTIHVNRYPEDSRSAMLNLNLEEGKEYITLYRFPQMTMELGIETMKVEMDLDDEGFGRLFADYRCRMGPDTIYRNHLDVRITPEVHTARKVSKPRPEEAELPPEAVEH